MLSMNFSNIEFDDFHSEINEMIQMIKDGSCSIGTEVKIVFCDNKEFTSTLGRLLMFSIISFPRSMFKEIDHKDFEEFLSLSRLNKDKMISMFHNCTLKEAYDLNVDIVSLKKYFASSIDLLADSAYAVNEHFGNTTNIIDMLVLQDKNKTVRDIINMTLNERSDYSEVVKHIKESNAILMEEIKKANNSFSYILSSVSPGQFQQVFCAVGYKPEVTSSNIFPHCVNTNLFKGYRNEMDYFVSALGARKAAITNAIQVSTGGYLSRKMILLVSGQVKNDVEDCGSTDFIPVTIASEDIAYRFKNRFGYLDSNENEVFEVNNNNYKELVGKEFFVRSPATCKVKSGVCKTCNGTSHKFNPFHSAIASIIKLTEQMIQRLLSSKHLLQINPKKIIIPDELKDYLFVDKTSLVSLKSFKLELNSIEDNSDDKKVCTKFTIIDGEEQIIFDATDEMEFLLDPIIEQINFKSKKNTILSIFEDNEVFNVSVENDELVTPLKKIIKLLESEKALNEKSLSENLAYLLNQLSISGLDSSSLAVELILRELIRNPKCIQERPKGYKEGDYVFLRLTNALVNHPSLAVSLAFERLSTVIEENIFKKNECSLIDGLF